ncbi:MAG TPA: hypothetical protein VGC76_17530 [Pyrinomonadaceae bacterium]|jgi:hypothetical protein
MEDILKALLYLLVLLAPIGGLAWLIYRLVKGNKGDDYSIK